MLNIWSIGLSLINPDEFSMSLTGLVCLRRPKGTFEKVPLGIPQNFLYSFSPTGTLLLLGDFFFCKEKHPLGKKCARSSKDSKEAFKSSLKLSEIY